jgi:hypothetical protein
MEIVVILDRRDVNRAERMARAWQTCALECREGPDRFGRINGCPGRRLIHSCESSRPISRRHQRRDREWLEG